MQWYRHLCPHKCKLPRCIGKGTLYKRWKTNDIFEYQDVLDEMKREEEEKKRKEEDKEVGIDRISKYCSLIG